jgi:hypothetical protein
MIVEDRILVVETHRLISLTTQSFLRGDGVVRKSGRYNMNSGDYIYSITKRSCLMICSENVGGRRCVSTTRILSSTIMYLNV